MKHSDSDDHPFVETPKKRSHMIIGLCFSSAGWKMKSLIILSGLQNLPDELRHFASNAYFATQYSGWMTTHLFAIWAIDFAHELSFHRAALPPALRLEWANLFVDGHSSRINSEAVEYLNTHCVYLIILPAHTSHVLQLFDRVIAAPFKAQVKQLYTLPARIRRPVITALQGQSDKAAARYRLVSAIVDSWGRTATISNCEQGFKATGICPFSPDAMMASEHVRPAGSSDELFAPRGNRIQISAKILNAMDERLALREHILGRMANPGDLVPPSFADIVQLSQGNLQNGRILCSIPSALVQTNHQLWEIHWG
jgi:hypothetical protein